MPFETLASGILQGGRTSRSLIIFPCTRRRDEFYAACVEVLRRIKDQCAVIRAARRNRASRGILEVIYGLMLAPRYDLESLATFEAVGGPCSSYSDTNILKP